MTCPLVITGYATVQLDPSIDGSGDLQVKHSSNQLTNCIEAEHETLNSPSGTIRVKIPDFTHGGDDWEISSSHVSGGASVSWSRDTDHAYYDFAAMTDAVEVDVVATSDTATPVVKTRKIWIKTKPVDAQPDRP